MSYLDRLREAIYTDPDDISYVILVNELTREGGKKATIHEIADSNQSVGQSQGNRAWLYNMPIYFTGEDYDTAADEFIAALQKKYTQIKPGILRHPRWGDINVFPFSFSQSEDIIDDVQISRVTVSFREIFPRVSPATDPDITQDIQYDMQDLQAATADANFFLDAINTYNEWKAMLTTTLGVITRALRKLVSISEDIQNEFDSIVNGITNAIDTVGSSVLGIMLAYQRIISLPNKLKNRVLSQVQTYAEMVANIAAQISGGTEDQPTDVIRNSATALELIGGYAVAATAEASVGALYQSRADAVAASDTINEAFELYQDTFETLRTSGAAKDIYAGDHNFYSQLREIVTVVNDYVLNQAFELNIEKKIILKADSDPITLCYEHYGTVDQEAMEFFQTTNKITGDEFYSIPAGREIVIYA